MRIVIFGLTVSSSWGNGHATLWRSLIRALDAAGHEVVFYEQDVPYYRSHRDLPALDGRARLRLYDTWSDLRREAARALNDADAAIVTSYCPDGRDAATLALGSRARVKIFYDLDTPVTLFRLGAGEDVTYLPPSGLGDFDLVLSFTGGRALARLRDRLGARRVATLYGSVDPAVHHAVAPDPRWAARCSYLGTWSPDRQDALDLLLLEPARRRGFKVVIGGAMYPREVAWPTSVTLVEHVPPPAHPAFYGSSPLTISVTRAPMAALGWCPSGRLFEAAACGVPVLSDWWEGLDDFFTPGEEILIARTTDEAIAAIERSPEELAAIGRRARERALAEHSGARRADELVTLIRAASSRAGGDA
jgi:spore maturation protein CgeB